MQIYHLKTNHIDRPVGFDLPQVLLQWKVRGSRGRSTSWVQIRVALDPEFEEIVYDSGRDSESDAKGTSIPIELVPRTRYYWTVKVCDDTGECTVSEVSYFETAISKESWNADWISPAAKDSIVFHDFHLNKDIKSARLYITGLGFYEVYLNHEKIGTEYLTPGINNYDEWIQYQTYELSDWKVGANHLEIWLGEGWYTGRYLHMGPGPDTCRYGTCPVAIAELHVTYKSGLTEVIRTDHTWKSMKGKIQYSSIYDGELLDDTFQAEEIHPVEVQNLTTEKLTARYSLPVVIHQSIEPLALIVTPNQELVLDFGQNLTGWVSIYNRLAYGRECSYQAGEILQQGNFYRDNYRSSQSVFTYRSDGISKWVRPHFTFYGFQYLKLEGFALEEIQLSDFRAQVLYSDLEQTGTITTSDPKVNQLISNVLWGQRSNFLDLPTDCPQRDERFGWTGDAQVFSATACYNMDCAAFFRKYIKDLYSEQKNLQGAVPFIVPNLCFGDKSSAAWGDAATVIPWNLYLMYGNRAILREEYHSMKMWTDYMHTRDQSFGTSGLWDSDNHFGDWLALDDPGTSMPTGKTDPVLIATAYYYYSTILTAKAAAVLNLKEDYTYYSKLALQIKNAYQNEFITPAGRLAIDTQTAYVLTLSFGLGRDNTETILIEGLADTLKRNNYKLQTGFAGTPYLCPVLSRYGRNDLAYQLLLNEEFPGWLYAINLGATTIWERWNSVLPDGTMNPDGMNSLNHYAYGSIQQWMYEYMLGIQTEEKSPGFRHFTLAPQPDPSLAYAEGSYLCGYGSIRSRWEYLTSDRIQYEFEIPFDTCAKIILKDSSGCHITINGEDSALFGNITFDPDTASLELHCDSGHYVIAYPLASAGKKNYNRETMIQTILSDKDARDILQKNAPDLLFIPPEFLQGTLKDQFTNVFGSHTPAELISLEEELKLL